jgi:hypothetical protein
VSKGRKRRKEKGKRREREGGREKKHNEWKIIVMVMTGQRGKVAKDSSKQQSTHSLGRRAPYIEKRHACLRC